MMKNFIKSELGFTIENLNPELCELRTSNDGYFDGFDKSNILILDFGEKVKGDIIHATLRFRGGDIRFHNAGRTCGCTTPSFYYDGEDIIVNVDYDTYKIGDDISVFFYLYDVSGKTITINLIMNS